MRKTLYAVFLALVFAPWAFTAADTRGTDFWLAFPGNYFNKGVKTLYITSDTDTSGTVYIPSPIFSRAFTVTAGSYTAVILPQDCEVRNSNTAEWRGIHVTSLAPVSVYGLNNDLTISDSFLAIPVAGLGTEYIIQSYYNSLTEVAVGGTQFAVVGTADNTQVTMTLPVDTGPFTSGTPYVFTLGAGQVYYLRNTSTPADLAGTFISADKRVAVFGSHACADVSVTEMYCDHLVEQLPPITSWGKEFVIIPLANRNTAPGLGDTYRFLASQNSTVVSLDGSPIASINAGQFYEVLIRGAGLITSNNRIMVSQYANSTTYDGETGDPFMMLVHPVEQYVDSYLVYSPGSVFPDNFLNLAVPNAAVGSVTVDGTTYGAGSYTTIGSSGYSALRLAVADGVHGITSTLPVGVSVYGFTWRDAYGHPGAAGVVDFVSTPTPTVTQTRTRTATRTFTVTRTASPGGTATFTATPTPSPSSSETATVSATATPTSTETLFMSPTNTGTGTISPTFTLTSTSSFTSTRTQTHTFTRTATQSMTRTITLTVTATPTITVSVTPSFTMTITITLTASFTRTMTVPPQNTPTCTPTKPRLELKLLGTYPNPAVRYCNIAYWLSRDAVVDIRLWDVSGEVVVIKSGLAGNQGNNVFLWNRRNSHNRETASGVFIYSITASTELGEKASAMDKLAVIK